MTFVPSMLIEFGALAVSEMNEARLQIWIGGAHSAVLALDRLVVWRTRAETETPDPSGCTPALLVSALVAHPKLGAAQAEAKTEASRVAVLRNLDVLEAHGPVRDVTGQGRFQV